MAKSKQVPTAAALSILFIIIILDTQTTVNGAKAGIELCINCIIPSLFPFSVLSKLLCSSMFGCRFPYSHFINRITGIPEGAETIFWVSIIGGYPIGALCINDAYKAGALSREDCHRLMGFCNNAGPAFIFGILYCVFPNIIILWSLYLINIISALAVSLVIPLTKRKTCKIDISRIEISRTLDESVKSIANICSWIVLFKILLSMMQHWFSWCLSPISISVITGLLELSNGCLLLQTVNNPGLKFILLSAFLAWGGLCVALQIKSATKDCGIGMYFPGKILQTCISVCIASLLQFLIFKTDDIYQGIVPIIMFAGVAVLLLVINMRKSKKVVAFV